MENILPIALTIGTAATSAGGYLSPPMMWQDLATHWPVQLGALTILTWQAGRQPLWGAFIIALIFLILITVIKEWEKKNYVQGTLAKKETFNPRLTLPLSSSA